MAQRSFLFAGGGTGGHIYPALAVAERIVEKEPGARIHFFCSERPIDAQILDKTGFEYTTLPAKGLSFKPKKLAGFCTSLVHSYAIAKRMIGKGGNCVVLGVGGFVAAPVCMAGHRLHVPVKLLNVDMVPGKANRVIARWADEIFVQFEESAKYFGKNKYKINVTGCPLRKSFGSADSVVVKRQLGLDESKKTLLITGASSGSSNINDAVCLLLERLTDFSNDWQIIHLTGAGNYEKVSRAYEGSRVRHNVLSYFDDMPSLLAAADLVVGRSGAVSVAEYATAGVPSICLPYPYHKDRHQYLNASNLAAAGAAVIVDDSVDENERAQRLWRELKNLMLDRNARARMKSACAKISRLDAGLRIAERMLRYAPGST